MTRKKFSFVLIFSALILLLAACGGGDSDDGASDDSASDDSASEDSGAAVENAKIAIGPPGSATNTMSKVILEAYGVEEGDYTEYQEGFGDAADLVQDGNIDISVGVLGLPAANIESLNASAGDARILSLSDEAVADIEENSGYKGFTIPQDSYEFLEEDVQTVAAFAVMIGSTATIDDELGYELARIMVENADEITHAQGAQMTLDNALNGAEGLPLHPGAARYYEEQGLDFDNPIAELTAEESDRKSEFVLGTGSQGGTYYPLGGEIANLWKEHSGENYTNIETGASVENIVEINNGDMDLGMTVHVPALDAIHGESEFEELGEIDSFAFIGHIYPEVIQIVTREATGISDLSDLSSQ